MDVVSDTLASTSIVERFGMWVLAEVELHNCVMVKLPDGKHKMQKVETLPDATITRLIGVRQALAETVPSSL